MAASISTVAPACTALAAISAKPLMQNSRPIFLWRNRREQRGSVARYMASSKLLACTADLLWHYLLRIETLQALILVASGEEWAMGQVGQL